MGKQWKHWLTFYFSHHQPVDDILVHTFNLVCSPSLYLPINFFFLEIQEDVENSPKMSETELNIFPTDFHLKSPFASEI